MRSAVDRSLNKHFPIKCHLLNEIKIFTWSAPLKMILYDLCDLLGVIYFPLWMLSMMLISQSVTRRGMTHMVSHRVETDGSIFLNLSLEQIIWWWFWMIEYDSRKGGVDRIEEEMVEESDASYNHRGNVTSSWK